MVHWCRGCVKPPLRRKWRVSQKPASFADHFSPVADRYASFRPRYPRALFAWLAEIAPRREVAWDCATGNGQAAGGLAEFFARVIATDASAQQLANATPHPRIEYRAASAEASGLPPQSADLITVAQAAHWFDLDRFYAEARRVARPGAILAVWCYGEMRFGNDPIDRALDHYYHDVAGPFWPPERKMIEARYATLPFPFAELVAPTFEIESEFSLPQLAGYLRTWSATQRFHAARGFDPVVELESRLRPHWPEVPLRPAWPLHLRVSRLS